MLSKRKQNKEYFLKPFMFQDSVKIWVFLFLDLNFFFFVLLISVWRTLISATLLIPGPSPGDHYCPGVCLEEQEVGFEADMAAQAQQGTCWLGQGVTLARRAGCSGPDAAHCILLFAFHLPWVVIWSHGQVIRQLYGTHRNPSRTSVNFCSW